jgi:hypothetical protein
VLYAGIPALRHDWNWPRTRLDFFSAFTLSTSGWFPIGFGFPHPNPSGYLASPLIDAAGLAVGPSAALWIYLAVAGALCAAAGWALASAIAGRDRKLLATAAAVVATFNPWVYNQIVAGHTYMIVAYAAAGLLLALLAAREDATSIRASLLAVLAYVQLQIFLVLACVLAVIALQRRRWLAVATVVVVALPTAIGIAGEFGGLARTPITLPWEENQSVQPLQALVLGGYFADYASQFDGFGQLPLAVLAALAVAGAIVGRRSPRVLGVLAATLTTIVAASGANGPLAFGFSKLVLSTPLVGLYRELYDLLGFAARVPAGAVVFDSAGAPLRRRASDPADRALGAGGRTFCARAGFPAVELRGSRQRCRSGCGAAGVRALLTQRIRAVISGRCGPGKLRTLRGRVRSRRARRS